MKRVLLALAMLASVYTQAQITASISSSTVCFGDSTRITATASSTAGSITAYSWDFDGDGVFAEGDQQKEYFTFPQADSTLIRLRVFDSAGDSLEVTTGVYVRPLPNAEIIASNGNEICRGDSTTVSWAFEPSAEVSFWTSGQSEEIVTVGDSGNFYLTVMDTLTCVGRDSLEIIVHELPMVTYTGETTIIVGDTASITAAGALNYVWTNVTGVNEELSFIVDSTDSIGLIVSPDVSEYAGQGAGINNWRIVGSDINGCNDTNYVQITIERKDVIEAPSIFTPNGDGYNDLWVISNPDVIQGCGLVILNQWGDVIYESSNYQSDWDGMTGGKNVPDGTYFYFFSCDDESKKFTGSITVIR